MTIGELLQACISTARVQFIHEGLLNVRSVRKHTNSPAHTRIEFATDPSNMTPNDALYFTYDRPSGTRTPKYIGIVVWVPWEQYDQFSKGQVPQ